MHRSTWRAAALRGSEISRFRLLLIAATVVLGAFLVAGSTPLQGATRASGDVHAGMSGYGEVTVSGTGVFEVCTVEKYLDDGDDRCTIPSVPIGTVLTFDAVAKRTPKSTESHFIGWSRPECEDAGSRCEVKTETADEWIVAQFSPVTLKVEVAGAPATITASGPKTGPLKRVCRDPDPNIDPDPDPDSNAQECVVGEFSAGERVTVRGESSVGAGAAKWVYGCDPYEDPPQGACVITMSAIENWVIVAFGEAEVPTAPPFDFPVHLAVDRGGDGKGSVTGGGHDADSLAGEWKIDCGSDCDVDRIQYQTRVRLTARATPGTDSEFDHWMGPPCLSQQVCTFTVGKYPKVRAIFKKTAPPRLPPDVELTKVADRSTASVGDTIVFRIDVRMRNTNGAASKVVVTDQLPTNVELVTTRANRGQGCTGSQTITCDVDFLSGALVATVEVVVRAKAAGEIVNRATATTDPSDPDPSNNTATATVTVAQPPDQGGESHPQKGVTRMGTTRADTLRGTPYSDVLRGLQGNDRLFGLAGSDTLLGGRGNDMLDGGAGPNVLDAGPGNDVIQARNGTRDTVRCGPGRDRVIADRSDLRVGCEQIVLP